MDETLTPVNDGQAGDGGPQATPVNDQTVNAENAEVTGGSQEQAAPEQAAAEGGKAQTKEENAQFARVRREAEARVRAEYEAKKAARDAEFASKAAQNGWKDSSGQPITTEEAYWREVDLRARMDTLVSQGVDEETARLRIDYERLKEERASEQRERETRERQQAENKAFFDFYREATGKEFTSADDIPDDVFKTAQENGVPLKYAYAEYLAKAAVEKEKSLALGKQAREANAKNAQTSPGSVTGTPQSDAVTEAEISAHADDVAWMNHNYDKVEAFYRKQKG